MRIENKGYSFSPWCICYLKQTKNIVISLTILYKLLVAITNRNEERKTIMNYQISEFKLHIPHKREKYYKLLFTQQREILEDEKRS